MYVVQWVSGEKKIVLMSFTAAVNLVTAGWIDVYFLIFGTLTVFQGTLTVGRGGSGRMASVSAMRGDFILAGMKS